MTLSGRVERRPVAPGSKSERLAVVLVTQEGAVYVLRRLGGNPFKDPQMEALVGKAISGEGNLTGNTFILERWREA